MSDDGTRTQSKPAETSPSLPYAWQPGRIIVVDDVFYIDDGSTWIELPTGGGGGGMSAAQTLLLGEFGI